MKKFLVILNGLIGDKFGGGGGGSLHMLQVSKFWSQDHEISFLIPKSGYHYAKSIFPALSSVYFSSYEGHVDGILALMISFVIRIIRSLLVKHRADVVLCASHYVFDTIPAIFLCRKINAKLVVYIHGFFLRTYTRGVTKFIASSSEHLSVYLLRKKADVIFAINSDIKNRLIEKGFDSGKILVITNGVDMSLVDSAIIDRKQYDACFCGRLVRIKGVYDLLDLWESVVKRISTAKLLIIGDGPEYSNIKKTILEKKLQSNITLTGFVSEEKKFSLIKSSKIFVFPSYDESWGVAVCEAMACGIPVICYDLPSYKIFGEGVVSVNIGDKEKLTELTIDLINHEDKCSKLGLFAKEVARPFNWDIVASKELAKITEL